MTWQLKVVRGAFVLAMFAGLALAAGAGWLDELLGWLW